MKLSLHWNKLIPLSLFIILIPVYSCHLFSKNGKPEIIKVAGATPATNELDLRNKNNGNAATFKVRAGKTIRWIVAPGIIQKITKIYVKPGTSVDVFSVPPDSIGGSLNWQGTIDRGAGGKTEDYNIDWIDLNGNHHTYDPKIQVY